MNLRDELRAIDHRSPPADLWQQVTHKAVQPIPPPRGHRLRVLILAAIISLVSISFLAVTFLSGSRPADRTPVAKHPVPQLTGSLTFVARHGTPFPNELYTVDFDSSEISKSKAGPAIYVFEPARSPTNSEVAFRGSFGEGDASVYVVDADGQPQLIHAGGEVLTAPSWAPSGDVLAVSVVVGSPFGNITGAVGLLDTRTERLTRLTDDIDLYRSDAYWEAASWNADGTRLAFSAQIGNDYQIHVVDSDGSGLSAVTEGSGEFHCPVWASQGEVIAFLGQDGIYTVTADQASTAELVTPAVGPQQCPAWSPDSEQMAFATTSGDAVGIFVVDVRSGVSRRVATATVEPGWDPTNYGCPRWSEDGEHVLFVSGDGIHSISVDGSSEELISTELPTRVHPACPLG